MGWGMLHAAGLGGGGLAGHYSDLSMSSQLHQQEPQLMHFQHDLPIHQQQPPQQQECEAQHEDMFTDRCAEDLLASLLQESGQLEEIGASLQDTDCSSSGDGALTYLGSPDRPGSSSASLPSPSSSSFSSCRVSSVAATRSHLIKEGLKLTIQSRRRERGQEDLRSPDEEDVDTAQGLNDAEDLTEEDEERRRRRRERNKVAATKCRNKKKERTQRLAVESTCLESNNQFLKEEIRRLEVERQELLTLLQNHGPACPMQHQGSHQSHHRVEEHQLMHYMDGQ